MLSMDVCAPRTGSRTGRADNARHQPDVDVCTPPMPSQRLAPLSRPTASGSILPRFYLSWHACSFKVVPRARKSEVRCRFQRMCSEFEISAYACTCPHTTTKQNGKHIFISLLFAKKFLPEYFYSKFVALYLACDTKTNPTFHSSTLSLTHSKISNTRYVYMILGG